MFAPLRRVLAHRQYRWFLGSWVAASTGYSVYAISIVWLTWQTTHSVLVVAGVLAVEQAAFCLTFVVAPIADRVRNQRSIFLASYPVQVVAALALGVGALRGELSAAEILGLVVVLSLLWDLSWAAANAAPGILLPPDDQFAVSGVQGVLGGVNSIAGFALGGVLILVVGAGGGMLLYAALLATATVLALPLRIAPPPRRERSFGESFRRGWATIVAAPGRPLLQLTAADAVQGLFAAAPALLIALLAVRSFGGDSTAYAVLFVAYVLGGVVAGAVVGHWNPRGRVGVLLGATLIAGGVFFAGVGNVPSLVVVVAAVWFGVGFAGAMYQDAKYAFLRGSVAPGELARVVSNLYLLPGVAATLGAVLLGEFAGRISVTAFAEIAGLGLAVAGVTALLLPGVRRLRY